MQKSMDYFKIKTTIDKAQHKNTAYKVQVYANKTIDDFVANFNDAGVSSKPTPAVLSVELSILNKPEIYKNYNRIINSPYTSNDNLDKMLVKNNASKQLDSVVKSEVERISKNLDYVEAVMKKYDIPTQQYQQLLKEQASKSIANRKNLLEQVAVKNGEILKSEGLNIPSNVFSYKDIETTAQSLLRESQMTSKFDEISAINDNYIGDGKDAPYTHKQWIWTGEGETTRHESNHLQKVRFDEPFIVVNDNTLDIDEMMYPCDPAGSYSNAYICYCECDYLIGEDDEYGDNLGIGTILDNADVFSETVPETPNVTFLPNVKGLFEPVGEPININRATIENELYPMGEGIYSIEPEVLHFNEKGNYEYKGIEIKQFDEYGSATLTAEEIRNHNNQFFENYSIKPESKIGEHTVEKSVIEEFNRFADETRHNDYESIMFCDDKGNVLYERTDYKEKSVSYSYKDLKLIMKENNIYGDLNCTHNHPTRPKDSPIYEFPTMLSWADVKSLFTIDTINIGGDKVRITPEKTQSVEYCNGMRMVLERSEGNGLSNPVLDDYIESGLTPAEYQITKDKSIGEMTELQLDFYDAYNSLNKAYFDFLKKGERIVENHVMDYMDEKIESGAYNPETATGEQFRAFQKDLQNEERRFAKELARDENNSFNEEFKYQVEVFKELGFNLSMEWLY